MLFVRQSPSVSKTEGNNIQLLVGHECIMNGFGEVVHELLALHLWGSVLAGG